MKNLTIDISRFKRSSSFYQSMNLMLTIKSFNLQEIRSRYVKSQSNANGKTGSVERRTPSIGGLVGVTLSNGNLSNIEVLTKIKEPRGIARFGEKMAFSSENIIYVIGNEKQQLSHPWLSYIHTLDFNKTGDRLLVSSSGFDLIMEFDLKTNECIYEWSAWEHGYNRGYDAANEREVILSRTPSSAANTLAISDPLTQTIPTAMRAAFINSVVYDEMQPDKILATLFHEGSVLEIDRTTGKTSTKINGLKTPHGGERMGKGYLATSTGNGVVIVQTTEDTCYYIFENLTGKPPELEEKEWLQNTKVIDGNFVTIDANRTSFVIFNPEKELIDIVPFDPNWAVQDMIEFTPSTEQIELIRT